LISLGFSKYDSLHIASSELSHSDVFVTVDNALMRRARRHSDSLTLRVIDPIRLAEEIFDGTIDRQPE